MQYKTFTFPELPAAYVVLGTCRQIATCLLCLTLKHAAKTLLLICAVENLTVCNTLVVSDRWTE